MLELNAHLAAQAEEAQVVIADRAAKERNAYRANITRCGSAPRGIAGVEPNLSDHADLGYQPQPAPVNLPAGSGLNLENRPDNVGVPAAGLVKSGDCHAGGDNSSV